MKYGSSSSMHHLQRSYNTCTSHCRRLEFPLCSFDLQVASSWVESKLLFPLSSTSSCCKLGMLHCKVEQPFPTALTATIAIHSASYFILLYITDIMQEADAMARPLQQLWFLLIWMSQVYCEKFILVSHWSSACYWQHPRCAVRQWDKQAAHTAISFLQ